MLEYGMGERRFAIFPAVAAAVCIAYAAGGSARAAEAPKDTPPPEGEPSAPTSGPIERMSDEDLKNLYLRCSRAAIHRQLGGGEIAMCSLVYERLLKGTFRGDFHALLEWRRGLMRPVEPLHGPF